MNKKIVSMLVALFLTISALSAVSVVVQIYMIWKYLSLDKHEINSTEKLI